MVPKAITLTLVNHSKENLQRELLQELYKPDVLEDLLKESELVVTRRKEVISMVQALNKAEECVPHLALLGCLDRGSRDRSLIVGIVFLGLWRVSEGLWVALYRMLLFFPLLMFSFLTPCLKSTLIIPLPDMLFSPFFFNTVSDAQHDCVSLRRRSASGPPHPRQDKLSFNLLRGIFRFPSALLDCG